MNLGSLLNRGGSYLRRYYGVILLLLVAYLSHRSWFSINTVLFHADWLHWTDDAAAEAWRSLASWSSYFGLGNQRTQISFTVIQSSWSFLVALGLNYDQAVKLTLMIPIAILGYVSPYVFARQKGLLRWHSLILSAFYASTTYFLIRKGSNLQIAGIYATLPLMVIACQRLFERSILSRWLALALLLTVGFILDVRIMYVAMIILFVIFAPKLKLSWLKSNIAQIILFISSFTLLNLFWVLPTLMGGAGSEIAELTSRGLFGDHLFKMQNAITLISSGWTGSAPDESFRVGQINMQAWIVPILAVIGVIATYRVAAVSKRLDLISYTVLLLIGMLLTKQSSEPFSGSYSWFYESLPGFELFREASKFYLITAFAYLGIFTEILKEKNHVYLKGFTLGALLLVSLVNLRSYFYNDFGALFSPREQPASLVSVNSHISNDGEGYRSAWLPVSSKWAYFSSDIPRYSFSQSLTNDFAEIHKPESGSLKYQISDFLSRNYSEALVGSTGARHLVVPPRDSENQDDVFVHYGKDRDFFINVLNSTPWLLQLDGHDGLYYNTTHSDYFTAFSEATLLHSYLEFDQKNRISHDYLGRDFKYVTDANFNHWTNKFFLLGADSLDSHVKDEELIDLIYPSVINKLRYENNDKSQKLYIESKEVNIDAEGVSVEVRNPVDIFSANKDDKLVLASEGVVIQLGQDAQGSRNLGIVDDLTKIYRVNDDQYRYSLQDFEESTDISSCSEGNSSQQMSSGASQDRGSSNTESLKVEAVARRECVVIVDETLSEEGTHLLEFDARVEGAAGLSYEIIVDGQQVSLFDEEVLDTSWKRYSTIFEVEGSSQSIMLRLNALPGTLREPIGVTELDNIEIVSIESVGEIEEAAFIVQDSIAGFSLEKISKDVTEVEENILDDGSFEEGTWQDTVGDCNNFDNAPRISMEHSTESVDGLRSLKLTAARHTACVEQKEVPVEENTEYRFSFMAKTDYASRFGAYLRFDDPNLTEHFISNEVDESGIWQSIEEVIRTPFGASSATVFLYGYPAGSDIEANTFFDDVSLRKASDLYNRVMVSTDSNLEYANPGKIEYKNVHTGKKILHILNAEHNFFLAMSESYNSNWKASNINSENHFKLNGWQNGWFIDINDLCVERQLCVQNEDGTWNLDLVIEFTPQRWFYVGSFISGTTFVGMVGYIGFDTIRLHRRKKHGTI